VFTDCINLTSINIPDSVSKLKRHCFAYCKDLTKITINPSIIFDFNTKYENDSNHTQFTKLHFAAKIDDVKMGEYLISTGANINAKDRYGILIKIIKHLFIMLQIMIQLK